MARAAVFPLRDLPSRSAAPRDGARRGDHQQGDAAMSTTYTRAELLHELSRELQMRRAVYPRFVSNGKLSKAKADHQIRMLQCFYDWAVSNMPDDLIAEYVDHSGMDPSGDGRNGAARG
jgi:hypothetical protein